MKVFFDTEFIEDGKTIELLSIGMVREDGRQLYLCAGWTDLSKASEWVVYNVYPHLPIEFVEGRFRWKHSDRGFVMNSKQEMIQHVLNFLPGTPEFWAYYADYDWVVFCQLWGRMIDLPKRFPKYCNDVKQLASFLAVTDLPKQEPSEEHNASQDALWTKKAYEFLMPGPLEAEAPPLDPTKIAFSAEDMPL